jgi:hypothetical protein
VEAVAGAVCPLPAASSERTSPWLCNLLGSKPLLCSGPRRFWSISSVSPRSGCGWETRGRRPRVGLGDHEAQAAQAPAPRATWEWDAGSSSLLTRCSGGRRGLHADDVWLAGPPLLLSCSLKCAPPTPVLGLVCLVGPGWTWVEFLPRLQHTQAVGGAVPHQAPCTF